MSQKTSINVEPLTCAIGAESPDGPSGQRGDHRTLDSRCVGCWRLLRSGESAAFGDVRLTAREIEVLRLLSLGYTYASAARRLGLSVHTVTTHVKKIYGKLGVHAATAAVMHAMKLGIIG